MSSLPTFEGIPRDIPHRCQMPKKFQEPWQGDSKASMSPKLPRVMSFITEGTYHYTSIKVRHLQLPDHIANFRCHIGEQTNRIMYTWAYSYCVRTEKDECCNVNPGVEYVGIQHSKLVFSHCFVAACKLVELRAQ